MGRLQPLQDSLMLWHILTFCFLFSVFCDVLKSGVGVGGAFQAQRGTAPPMVSCFLERADNLQVSLHLIHKPTNPPLAPLAHIHLLLSGPYYSQELFS